MVMNGSGSSSKKKYRFQPPVMVTIPEGEFMVGTSEDQIRLLLMQEDWAQEWFDSDLFEVEQPYHAVNLPAFEIGRTPVTNAEYYEFIMDTGYRAPRGWVGFTYKDETEDHPVTGINLEDCKAYIAWLNKRLLMNYRLPTEIEWEKAARGPDGRIYPWGNDFNPWRCNTIESGKMGTTSVGSFSPTGDSVYGVADMAGNVYQWTSSALTVYPYDPANLHENPKGKGKIVVRGGAWYYSRKLARCASREIVLPTYQSPSLGFRLARSIN